MTYFLFVAKYDSFSQSQFNDEYYAKKAFEKATHDAQVSVAALYGPDGMINAFQGFESAPHVFNPARKAS